MKINLFLFAIFSITVPMIAMEEDDAKIANSQNQTNQNVSSSQSGSLMEIDGSSSGTKRKREEFEREHEQSAEDSQNIAKKPKIDIESQQDEQAEKPKRSNVNLLTHLAAKKIADYLANPETFTNFEFDPALLHQDLKDLIVYYLYKYYSNKVWDVNKKCLLLMPVISCKPQLHNPTVMRWEKALNIGNEVITYIDEDLKVLNLSTGSLRVLKTKEGDSLSRVKLSEDDKLILAGYNSGLVKMYNLESDECLDLVHFDKPIYIIEISKDNKFAVISDGYKIETWSLFTRSKIASVPFSNDNKYELIIKISADSTVVLISVQGPGGYVLVVDLLSGTILRNINASEFHRILPIKKLAIMHDEDDETQDIISVFDLDSGQELYRINDDPPVVISHDENFLVSRLRNTDTLIIRDLQSGKILKLISYDSKLELFTNDCLLRKNEMTLNGGKFIISSSENCRNSIFDSQCEPLAEIFNFSSDCCLAQYANFDIKISSDKKLIFAKTSNDKIQIIDAESIGNILHSVEISDADAKLFVSKNNKYIILVSDDKNIEILKLNLDSDQIIDKFYSEHKNIQDALNFLN